MLTIRSGQMAVFEQTWWAEFARRVADGIAAAFPDQAGAELIWEVKEVLHRGRKLGFESEYELYAFALVRYRLGPDFEQDPAFPWVREVLDSKDYSPRTKIDLLLQLSQPVREDEPPVEYDDLDTAEEDPDDAPDEEVSPLDEEEVADFEPESEEPEELPEDEIFPTSDDEGGAADEEEE